MAKRIPGEGRRGITPGDQMMLARSQPATGDGWTGGQKPKTSEVNIPGVGGRKSRLRLPRWLGGKHRA